MGAARFRLAGLGNTGVGIWHAVGLPAQPRGTAGDVLVLAATRPCTGGQPRHRKLPYQV